MAQKAFNTFVNYFLHWVPANVYVNDNKVT